ncbi:hypothetical protein BH23THE1_BH23THE1_33130 [soil metagenome]
MSMIVIDYGGSTVHHIALILSELGINSITILSNDDFPEGNYIGIILSGGPDHVYQNGSRQLPNWIDYIDLPVFCICYGLELMVRHLGGTIYSLPHIERGPTLIHSIKHDPLLGEFKTRLSWMNHYDTVKDFPENLELTSFSQNGYIASLNDRRRWWGVQFHPENMVGIDWGREIFENFITICRNYHT